jgi:hypothetical protein
MATRTRKSTPAIRQGRLDKAKQFAEAAELMEGEPGLKDAYVSNCVLAGIAAADVICCARLGEHAVGENHQEAIALLERADRSLAKDLSVLLKMKTSAAYSDVPSNVKAHARAGRAMKRLVDAAILEP